MTHSRTSTSRMAANNDKYNGIKEGMIVVLRGLCGESFAIVKKVSRGGQVIDVQLCRERVVGQDPRGHYGNMIVKPNELSLLPTTERFTWLRSTEVHGDRKRRIHVSPYRPEATYVSYVYKY